MRGDNYSCLNIIVRLGKKMWNDDRWSFSNISWNISYHKQENSLTFNDHPAKSFTSEIILVETGDFRSTCRLTWGPDLPVTPSSGPDVYAPPWHRYPASQGPLISRRPGVSQYLPLSHWVQLSTCSKSTWCQTNHHNIVRQRTPDFTWR